MVDQDVDDDNAESMPDSPSNDSNTGGTSAEGESVGTEDSPGANDIEEEIFHVNDADDEVSNTT